MGVLREEGEGSIYRLRGNPCPLHAPPPFGVAARVRSRGVAGAPLPWASLSPPPLRDLGGAIILGPDLAQYPFTFI